MRIGVFGSEYQAGKQNAIKELFDRLQEQGAEIWVEDRFHRYLSQAFAFTPDIRGLITGDTFPLDMVFSLGGDGTFLRTAVWVGRQPVPVLGINTGHLGFLADVSTSEIGEIVGEIFRGAYRLEEKSLLQIASAEPFPGPSPYALNEIAILKRDTASMIAVSVYLNDEFLTEYLADGLLLSTPTGSTAYNLSVNGPILLPQSGSLVLSPVAPHSLNMRPLVIPENYTLRMRVESRKTNFLVSLDGRSATFPSGSEFLIRKADFTLQVVKRLQQSFYDTLRKKLLWGADLRRETPAKKQ
ncbi:MAG: NAD kinase [Dysgonamonadaceae bacterium]|jgi:NAD+ kinase|nr:NAD kinase [Dysgonamonadaceae bacterium]